MKIIGNYTLSSLFTSAHGPFVVTLTNVVAKGNASVAVERDGKLRTQDISMDMSFSGLTTDFKNLGLFGIHISNFICIQIPDFFEILRFYGEYFPRNYQWSTESCVRFHETVHVERSLFQITNGN